MKIEININITLSKILAFLVLIIGSVYSYMYQDASALIATFSAATTIIGLKTYMESKEKQKIIENNGE